MKVLSSPLVTRNRQTLHLATRINTIQKTSLSQHWNITTFNRQNILTVYVLITFLGHTTKETVQQVV